jgi:intergrase/recombinase
MLSRDKIDDLVSKYLRSTLNELEEERTGSLPSPDEVDEQLDLLEDFITEDRIALAEGHYHFVRPKVDKLLAEEGVEPDKKAPWYKLLCREMLKASIVIGRVESKRMVGDYENDFDDLLKRSQKPVEESRGADEGKSLSEVVEAFMRERGATQGITEKTNQEYTATFDLFLDSAMLGDVPIKGISRDDITGCLESLQKLPPNRNKSPRYKGKSVAELLEMDIEKTVSVRTVNKTMDRISMLLKWANRQGIADNNVAEGLGLKEKRTQREERNRYSKEDLQRVVDGLSKLDGKNPERYWIPLITMHSGMRLNEVCQLYLEDVQKVDGVWCFDINENAEDKKLKTPASARVIPVHPLLIELGFMDYVK